MKEIIELNTLNNEKIIEPKLLYNDYTNGMKLSHEINVLLDECEEFYFSVAFIAKSGLATIKQTLLELDKKGVKGKIITSTYLGFNSPDSFKELLKFKNVEVQIYNENNTGFHPKGYIFKKNNEYKIIVGSSNLTQSALSTNQEWNLLLTSQTHSEVVNKILNEFNYQWDHSFSLNSDWINEYAKDYIKPKSYNNFVYSKEEIKPNLMQEEALSNLKDLRSKGKDKALLISATGTGKTYLAAFDVKAFNAKKVLFIVHRETIAKAALKTFKKLMPEKNCGMFSGVNKDNHADYIFSTIQTIHKREYLTMFEKDEFDYIIIDEVHRAGADSYNDIFEYFTPKFLLGMSATPERTDGIDIYKKFDYNIAYEIRLSQAMEYDLLCPFHYYGITDLTIDNQEIDDKAFFNLLVEEKRVDYIIDKIEFYGYSGSRVKGLIFVSQINEAKALSKIFNQKGYKTIALTGEDDNEAREKAMDKLEADSGEMFDYIFTVDIFNEGVDIPQVNQIVMLRPTQSAIIFVQQLGRGLRKNDFKDYVVVIDFIANYNNNFLIPIALSGDVSYNKDNIRRHVSEGSLVVPGSSSISFDEISKKRIFQSIDQSNFAEKKLLVNSYKQLKLKLGRIPNLLDFDKYESIDVLRIFENKGFGSYHNFLSSIEDDYTIEFNPNEKDYLIFVSSKLADGKRIQELLVIESLIYGKNAIDELTTYLNTKKQKLDDNQINTIKNELIQNFATGTGSNTFKHIPFINNDFSRSIEFSKCLENKEFKQQLIEVIDFAKHRFRINYSNTYKTSDFVLYQKYTYYDVCRLLNWDKSIVPLNIGGYKYDTATNTLPIFINYDKGEDVKDSQNYQDKFLNEYTLEWDTKNGVKITSELVKKIIDYKNNNIDIHLFVRKNKDDKGSKEFYYLGNIYPISTPFQTTIKDGDNVKSVVRFTYKLDNPVRRDIYEYITK